MQRKYIVITIAAVVFVAGLTVLTLFAARGLTTHPTVKNSPTVTQTAVSVITELQKEATAKTILKDSVVSLMSSKQAQTMYLKDPGLNKYVQVTTNNGALISQKNSYTDQQLKATTKDLTSYLVKQGLTTTQPTNDTTVVLSVSDQDLMCQLKTLSSASGPVMQIQLLCIDKTSYNNQVSLMSHLSSLWKDASSTAYDQLSVQTLTKDSYTIAQLFAAPKNSGTVHILLFVKNSDTWTYIGDAGSGTSVVYNEKYVINQSVKDGLDNPKYGAFLHDVLFGAAL